MILFFKEIGLHISYPNRKKRDSESVASFELKASPLNSIRLFYQYITDYFTNTFALPSGTIILREFNTIIWNSFLYDLKNRFNTINRVISGVE